MKTAILLAALSIVPASPASPAAGSGNARDGAR